MKKPIRISHAPKEKIKFVEKIAQLFVKEVLGISDSFITDDSTISDFRPFGSCLKKIKPLANGNYLITLSYYKNSDSLKKFGKNMSTLNLDEKESIKNTRDLEFPREDLLFPEDVLLKTQEVFGVDISPAVDLPLFEIAHLISSKITASKRNSLLF